MSTAHARRVVEEIFSLYERYGHADYIGEPVSQLEHMSQSAALAQKHGADDEVVLAAFFHDIGHICVARNKDNDMGGFGTKRHEQIGADFLRSMGFSPRLARLIENHVSAKRYLTFRQPSYYNSLSSASRETLKLQGGPMSEREALEFENDPLFHDSLLLRKWDELAKETEVPVNNLLAMKELAVKILSRC